LNAPKKLNITDSRWTTCKCCSGEGFNHDGRAFPAPSHFLQVMLSL